MKNKLPNQQTQVIVHILKTEQHIVIIKYVKRVNVLTSYAQCRE